MRVRRLRPSFDMLGQRITPSDLVSVGGSIATVPVATPSTCIVTDLGPWLVAGDPQQSPTNALQPCIDPTTW